MSSALTYEQGQAINAAFLEKMASDDLAVQKEAADTVTDYTRLKVRELSFYDRCIAPQTVTADRFRRSVQTDRPVIVVPMEHDAPAAATFPFGTLPTGFEMKYRSYEVPFARFQTQVAYHDVELLACTDMDVRQVTSDAMVRELDTEQDTKFIQGVNEALVAVGTTIPGGTAQWQTIYGGVTRSSMVDGRKLMPSSGGSLTPKVALLNHITFHEPLKWQYQEHGGGNMSADWLKSGEITVDFMGMTWVSTIKKGLVPTNTVYYFADPSFIGKNFVYTDTVMVVDKKGYMFSFFFYKTHGGAMGNVFGVARADFR